MGRILNVIVMSALLCNVQAMEKSEEELWVDFGGACCKILSGTKSQYPITEKSQIDEAENSEIMERLRGLKFQMCEITKNPLSAVVLYDEDEEQEISPLRNIIVEWFKSFEKHMSNTDRATIGRNLLRAIFHASGYKVRLYEKSK
ncbi:MAG: hypothetical protein ACTSXG_01935 [Alphaproteobacteria bacterium]